ncbi:ATP-binding protein [Rudanella paleaurantiibacter]|uniref:ATP-binding protein n=1 Tax=Rudanella paleaurantiibacter TaxID=2614655 RepID=UPI001626DD69|nr:ATP-binding protein [Rudanella paleaurantiibacter]
MIPIRRFASFQNPPGQCLYLLGKRPERSTLQVCQAYAQAEPRTGTANEKGTGLGLVLCREFIRLNKGEMSIQSQLHAGTTITLQWASRPVKRNRLTNHAEFA